MKTYRLLFINFCISLIIYFIGGLLYGNGIPSLCKAHLIVSAILMQVWFVLNVTLGIRREIKDLKI